MNGHRCQQVAKQQMLIAKTTWCSSNFKHLTNQEAIKIIINSRHITSHIKKWTLTFVNFAVYAHTLIRQLPVPLLPLSFTPNLITVILSTINSLSLNYPISSRSRTLLLVLSWKLPSQSSHNYPTSIPSQAHLHSTSSQYSLFILRYSCSASFIIISKNNWSLLSLCFTLSLESASFVSS